MLKASLFLTALIALVSADSNLPVGGRVTFSPTLRPSRQLQARDDVLTPRALFARQGQQCDPGQKYCKDADGCCGTTDTCCGSWCTPLGGECCDNQHSCDVGEKCCGDGCMDGILSECCSDGSYCTQELGSCAEVDGEMKCRKFGLGDSDDGAKSLRPAGVLGSMVLAGVGAVNLL